MSQGHNRSSQHWQTGVPGSPFVGFSTTAQSTTQQYGAGRTGPETRTSEYLTLELLESNFKRLFDEHKKEMMREIVRYVKTKFEKSHIDENTIAFLKTSMSDNVSFLENSIQACVTNTKTMEKECRESVQMSIKENRKAKDALNERITRLEGDLRRQQLEKQVLTEQGKKLKQLEISCAACEEKFSKMGGIHESILQQLNRINQMDSDIKQLNIDVNNLSKVNHNEKNRSLFVQMLEERKAELLAETQENTKKIQEIQKYDRESSKRCNQQIEELRNRLNALQLNCNDFGIKLGSIEESKTVSEQLWAKGLAECKEGNKESIEKLQNRLEERLKNNSAQISSIDGALKNAQNQINDDFNDIKMVVSSKVAALQAEQTELKTKFESLEQLQQQVASFKNEYREFVGGKLATLVEEGANKLMDKQRMALETNAISHCQRQMRVEWNPILDNLNEKIKQFETNLNEHKENYNDHTEKINKQVTDNDHKRSKAETEIRQLQSGAHKFETVLSSIEAKLKKSAQVWTNEVGGPAEETASKATPGVLEPPAVMGISSVAEISKKTSREIKAILAANGVDSRAWSEKSELVDELTKLWKDLRQKAGVVPDKDLCAVCMENSMDCAFLECGHMCTCYECGSKIKDCPVCRMYVTRVQRIYRS